MYTIKHFINKRHAYLINKKYETVEDHHLMIHIGNWGILHVFIHSKIYLLSSCYIPGTALKGWEMQQEIRHSSFPEGVYSLESMQLKYSRLSASRSKYKMPPLKHFGETTNPVWGNFQEEEMAEHRVLARQSGKCVMSRRNSIANIWT